MKNVITHHDGHGLNECITITATDEPGPGGAHHVYVATVGDVEVFRLQMQKGPRNEPGSTPGMSTEAVIAVLEDILKDFQAGPFPSREGALTLTHLQQARMWCRERADERARRNALGFNVK